MSHVLSEHDAQLIRQHPQTVKRYLSVCPRAPVFQAQVSAVNQDSATNGIVSLTYSNVTLGVYADALPGLTVDVGTTPGARDVGVLRVRKTTTATTLYVNETAPGEVPVEAGHWLTVRDERLIWQKLPYLTAESTGGQYYDTFSLTVDYDVPYTDEHSNYRPLANVVGDMAGWVDAGADVRTVELRGDDEHVPSVAVAKSASIASYVWDIRDGVLADGYSLTDATIVAKFPVGFRYVSLTVSDTNGETSTRYFPVFVHDEGHPPLPYTAGFVIERDETVAGGGREMDVLIYGQPDAVNEQVLPRGTLCVYWEEAQFGDEQPPELYRQQFMGWSLRDAIQLRAYRGAYSLTIGGPAAWLNLIGGIQESFLCRSTPSAWYHMKDITDDRAIASVLRYRSTALDVCNLVLSGVTYEWGQPDTSDYAAIKVDKGSMWDQVTRLAQEIAGQPGVDTHGTIWLRREPGLIVLGRDDLPATLELSEADWSDEDALQWTRDYSQPVGTVQLDGFYWTGSESVPLRARAPGRAPGRGPQTEIPVAQVLPADSGAAAQAYLRQLAGHWREWLNNPSKDMGLNLIGNMDVFEPAWREWIAISGDVQHVRGEVLEAEHFTVDRVTITHSSEPPYKRIALTVSAETFGELGEIVPIPSTDIVPTDWDASWNWYPGIWDYELLPFDLHWGVADLNNIAAFADNGYVYITSDFMDSSPTWAAYYLSVSGTPRQFVVDAFSPGYLGTGTAINGWLFTTHGIYRIADIFGARTVTEQHTFSDPPIKGVSADASFGTQGHVVCTYWHADYVWATYTTNGGTSWATSRVNSLSQEWPGDVIDQAYGCYVSSKTAGLVYTSAKHWPSGYDNFNQIYVSRDFGKTWGAGTGGPRSPKVAQGAQHGLRELHVPYHDNPNEDMVFYLKGIYGTVYAWQLRRVRGGSTDESVAPAWDHGPLRSRWGISSSPTNRMKMAAIMGKYYTWWEHYFYVSYNGGDTWINRTPAGDVKWRRCAIAGDNEDVIYLWGDKKRIAYSPDFGVTIYDKSGNLSYADEIVGICGGTS